MPFCYKSLFLHFSLILAYLLPFFSLLFYVEHCSLSYGVTLRLSAIEGDEAAQRQLLHALASGSGLYAPRTFRVQDYFCTMAFIFELSGKD